MSYCVKCGRNHESTTSTVCPYQPVTVAPVEYRGFNGTIDDSLRAKAEAFDVLLAQLRDPGCAVLIRKTSDGMVQIFAVELNGDKLALPDNCRGHLVKDTDLLIAVRGLEGKK